MVRSCAIASCRVRLEHDVVRALWNFSVLQIIVLKDNIFKESFAVKGFLLADDIKPSSELVRHRLAIYSDSQHPHSVVISTVYYSVSVTIRTAWTRNSSYKWVSQIGSSVVSFFSKSQGYASSTISNYEILEHDLLCARRRCNLPYCAGIGFYSVNSHTSSWYFVENPSHSCRTNRVIWERRTLELVTVNIWNSKAM